MVDAPEEVPLSAAPVYSIASLLAAKPETPVIID